MDIIINLIGAVLFISIIVWFWFMPSKSSAKKMETDVVDIIVDNGVYTPKQIIIKAGKPTTLRFNRKDASPCSAIVIFDSLNINKELPFNEITDFVIDIKEPGEYKFACQMGMYQGVITAE